MRTIILKVRRKNHQYLQNISYIPIKTSKLIEKKSAKNLDRQFSKEDRHMVNEYMKRCSI